MFEEALEQVLVKKSQAKENKYFYNRW